MKTLVGVVAALLAAAPLKAQTATLNLSSSNELRGIQVSEQPIAQAIATDKLQRLSGFAYTTFSTEQSAITEIGAGASYDCQLGNVHLSPGLALYRFVQAGKYAPEATMRLTLDGKVATQLFFVQNFGEGTGNYLEASASMQLGPLDTRVAVAYNKHYYRTETGPSHAELNAAVPIQAAGMTITPSAHYTQTFGGDSRVSASLRVEKEL